MAMDSPTYYEQCKLWNATAVILISGSQAYEFKGRNASLKTGKKQNRFDQDLSLTSADTIAYPFVATATPTSGTLLPSKPHARKQIIPTHKFAESSTSLLPPTYRCSAAAAKPNDRTWSKTSRTVTSFIPERKSTINDLAIVRNLSRNSRESAPSPEPSPPLGTREKGTRPVMKTAATSSIVSTALNKRSRVHTSEKETKQQTEDAPAKSTHSKGKPDIDRPPATNKAMAAKAITKAKHVHRVAESGVTKTKANKHPKAAATTTSQTTTAQTTTGQTMTAQTTTNVTSNSKPKKRLDHRVVYSLSRR